MCPEGALLPILTPGSRTRQRFLGDRDNHKPILPSEVPVGRQKLRVPRTPNQELGHMSSLVNLTTLHPRW